MKTFACVATLFTAVMAAPSAPLDARQTTTTLPQLKEITYRVSNLQDPNNVKFVDTKLKVNGGALNFDENNDLVGAGKDRLNDDGHVRATGVSILTPLTRVHCNLYNAEKHVICEFNNLIQSCDFDGVEAKQGVVNKSTNADKYSLLCYYV